jgi:hypothetical protein
LRHFYIKCIIILPRQARDKHSENSNKEWRFFLRGVRTSSLRAGYNAYGDEGVRLVAANLAGWGMRGCRSLVRTLLLQQAPLVFGCP